MNHRRAELIRNHNRTPEENTELEKLQAEAMAVIQREFPSGNFEICYEDSEVGVFVWTIEEAIKWINILKNKDGIEPIAIKDRQGNEYYVRWEATILPAVQTKDTK